MRIANIVLFSAGLLALTPTIGAAQDKPVHINVGGGPTFVLGDLGDRFVTGYGPEIGVQFNMSERVGFQFNYGYTWFGIPDQVDIAAGRFSANHQTHALAFDFVGNLTPSGGPARVYVMAGPSTYYRKVEITEYVGNGIVCDPWYYICGTYPITGVLGSRGGWDFGYNIGGGVGIRIGESAEFYVETRYHYAWGPEIKSTVAVNGQTGGNANGQYLPLTFGFRF